MSCFHLGFLVTSFLFFSHSMMSYAQQYYDSTLCSSQTVNPGTQYICNSSSPKSCRTFLVYRATRRFNTLSAIAGLFGVGPTGNNLTSPSQPLKPGREVLLPVTCLCSGKFFHSNLSYVVVPEASTFTEIACGAFEGLVKSVTLSEENLGRTNLSIPKVGSVLGLPLKCACPDRSSRVKYLVTYPIIEGDETFMLGLKFGVPLAAIWEANHLEPTPTIYPNTTLLVPIKEDFPTLNIDAVPDSVPPIPGFLPTIPIDNQTRNRTALLKKLYIGGSVLGFCLVLVALLACGLYIMAMKKWKSGRVDHSSARRSSFASTPRSSRSPVTRSSTNSCLSPDLLAGIKYSLCNYSLDELRRATGDFSSIAGEADAGKRSGLLYKGVIEGVQVMVRRTRFEDTRLVIDVHSKLNHVNIVKLLGVCYGGEDQNIHGFSWSYLVFEHPPYGCLRDCLSRDCLSSADHGSLGWHKRTQIAFDIATALHYLHYCMVPPYNSSHMMNINSRNIFVTPGWRAKLAVFGTNSPGGDGGGGWVAPEQPVNGLGSEKVDIFALGVVLLELVSAREDVADGLFFKECIGFLGSSPREDGGGGGCFDQLRSFMDPSLKEDYPLAEALCLAVLAKACVEDDPLHRPTIDDIIKVLARMV